jgi:hypothetical protein
MTNGLELIPQEQEYAKTSQSMVKYRMFLTRLTFYSQHGSDTTLSHLIWK